MVNLQTKISIGRSVTICHFNIEGSSVSKSEYLSRKAIENKVDVIAVQETHITNGADYHDRGRVPGYKTAAYLLSPIYGTATYVREDLDYNVVDLSQEYSIFRIVVEVRGIKTVNVYKPPNLPWPENVLNSETHPATYIGDFNSHHTLWGYAQNNACGIQIQNWMDTTNLFLVHDMKDLPTFNSARWNRGYSPDLCFVTRDQLDRPLKTTRKVIPTFPRSQHRPVIIKIGTEIDTVNSIPKPRWNFQKANWKSFSAQVESSIRFVPNEIDNYERFLGIIKAAAKKSIPRGYRKRYIPCWTSEMEDLYREFEEQQDDEISDHLLELLSAARKTKWEKQTQEIDFTHSSRKGWKLLRHLGETAKPLSMKPNIDPEKVATVLLQNSKKIPVNKHHYRDIKSKLRKLKKSLPTTTEFDKPFQLEELTAAIKSTKLGKAAGLDGFYPEFIHNIGNRAKLWVLKFLNKILKSPKLPSLMRKSMIIAILKPGKSSENPNHYRPIALLSIMYKLLEKMIINRIDAKIESALPAEFAGFRKNRGCCDQVLALTTHIETGFEKKLKTALALIDLSSAYDTVWRMAFLWKLGSEIRSRKIIDLVNSMLCNRMFRVHINNRSSRIRALNDGLAQGSVGAPTYFNVYIMDMPVTQSRKFGYADDLALTIQTSSFEAAEQFLESDLRIMKSYYIKWRLCLNLGKTEVAMFHLDNASARRKLNVWLDGIKIEHNFEPTYLGTTLDRPMTFRPNLEKLSQKLKPRINLIQKLAGTDWGANGESLRTAVLSLVFSTAEYCAPVWYNSSHVDKIDVQLNIAMRTIAGAVDSTPLPWLHVMTNIAPPHLRRKLAAHREWKKCVDDQREYILPIRYELENPPPRRLTSRYPIWLDNEIQVPVFDINASWKSFWDDSPSFSNKFLIDKPYEKLGGSSLQRKEWKMLNRFRCGHGCSGSHMFRWNFRDTPYCDCNNGTTVQTISHILNDCPLRRLEGGIQTLNLVTTEAIDWLRTLDINV